MSDDASTAYAVLLRAVNVGGNTLSMATLRSLLGSLGYEDVATYLQSGNATLRAATDDRADLEVRIAAAIEAAHGRAVEVIVRRGDELARVVAANPFLARQVPANELHATFLKDAPAPEDLSVLRAPDGCEDELALGAGVVYVRCRAGYGNTKLHNAFIERRARVPATTRNWRTVLALLERTRE